MNTEIKKLEDLIDEADQLYYDLDSPTITDVDYDALKDRLRVLDPTNRRLKSVGGSGTASASKIHWEKYTHKEHKMGSLNKITTEDALEKFCIKLPGPYLLQHKLDGISIKLIYENGKLIKAVTRGKNDVGEVITKNVLKMGGIPSTIKYNGDLVVRGEIVLFHSKFDRVGGKNPRNAAGGAAKRLDGVGCRFLNVKTYCVMNSDKVSGIKTECEAMIFLSNNGFDIVDSIVVKTTKDIQVVMDEYIKKTRKTIDWDIDGMVIKTNEIKLDDWDYPTRAIAYKFPSEKGITKLLKVDWQDSGGRITPVAILEPVEVGGTTIARATLNNTDYIAKLDLHVNDQVYISRRNDVIPCVEGVAVPASNRIKIIVPTKDAQGYPIVRAKNSNGDLLVYLVSTNPNSSAKVVRRIMAWYRAHDTKGVAEETVISILEAGIAKDLPDFFDIGLAGHSDLASLEGFGAGKFRVLNKATLKTKNTDIIRFLNGIDLQGFGTSRFEAVLEAYNKPITIKDFCFLLAEETFISNLAGFGSNTAKALRNEIKDKEDIIKEMLKRVTVDDWTPQKKVSTKINGLSFCFTGAMDNDRDTMEKAVKKNGGIVAGVSKHLDYLVTNDQNSGSTKNEKATKLGIKKISEKEFLKMIDNKL